MNYSNYSEFALSIPTLVDARFHRGDVFWDETTHVARIDCWIPSRVELGDESAERKADPKSGWRKLRWSLVGVASIEVKLSDEVAFYEIGSITYQAGSGLLTVRGHYGIVIEIRVSEVAGEIVSVDEHRAQWDRRRESNRARLGN